MTVCSLVILVLDHCRQKQKRIVFSNRWQLSRFFDTFSLLNFFFFSRMCATQWGGWVDCNIYNRAKYRCTLTIVQKVILCKFDGYKNGTYPVIYANLLSIYVASRFYYINVSFFLHLISVSFYAIIVNEM